MSMPNRVAYFLISYRSPDDRFLHTRFMTLEQVEQHQGGAVERRISINDLEGKYWFCEVRRGHHGGGEHMALSTAEIERRLNRGFAVRVIRGPLDNRNDAEERLELYWEALTDRDED